MKLVFFLLFFCLSANSAFSYEKLFKNHCKTMGVPKDLAMAIARQESTLNPNCVNVEGKDFWPQSREEAEKIIRDAQEKDLSYDVGIMQINSQWIKQWKIDPVSLLDPETNIRYGLKILKGEIDKHGMNWRAIGSYHSPNPLRARRYALMVYRRMRGSPELRSMLVNPRLNGNARLLNRKFGDLQINHQENRDLLKHEEALRHPVPWK